MERADLWSSTRFHTRSSFCSTFTYAISFTLWTILILQITLTIPLPIHAVIVPESAIKTLELSAEKRFNWFSDNSMKANSDKSHVILSTSDTYSVNCGGNITHNSATEKLLGITIDSKLTFEKHVSDICNKASQKLHTLLAMISHTRAFKREKLL